MNSEHLAPASGTYTSEGVPHGYSTLTPFIAVEYPERALEFYKDVFGARLVSCSQMGDQVVHAEIQFANGRLQVGVAQDAFHLRAVDPGTDETQFSIGIYVLNVDVLVQDAVAAGAALREPVTTFVSGDRFGSIRDPFGVRWNVMTRIEDLSDDESSARVAKWMASLSGQ